MKKIMLLFAAALTAVTMSAASYGIMINGTDFHAGTANTTPVDPSFQEYMVTNVQVPAGATLQLYDLDNRAGWAVVLDAASVAGIVKDGDHYTCAEGGCFSFYIKLKFNADQLYIGNGDCTNNNNNNNPPSTQEGNPRYYWKGYVDGEDIEPTEANLFVGGIASDVIVYENAYLFVIYQVDGQEGVQYMTSSYVDGPTHATLSVNGGGNYQKMHVTAGTHTLYLYDNGDGTLELSTQPMAGKQLVQASSAVEQVAADRQSVKFVQDGRLYIRVNGQVYDINARNVR